MLELRPSCELRGADRHIVDAEAEGSFTATLRGLPVGAPGRNAASGSSSRAIGKGAGGGPAPRPFLVSRP
jgi:hypothetical protein